MEDDKKILKDSLARPERFGIIYEKYHDKIFSHIYKLTQDIHITEDLTEETFLKVIENRRRIIKADAPFENYIYRIATNVTLNFFRRSKVKTKTYDKLRSKEKVKNSLQDSSGSEEELKDAIQKLPEQERVCIIMYYAENKKLSEIAFILGQSVPVISRILKKAKKDLREILRKNSDGKL